MCPRSDEYVGGVKIIIILAKTLVFDNKLAARPSRCICRAEPVPKPVHLHVPLPAHERL